MVIENEAETPRSLAKELGVTGLAIRRWLRAEYPRPEIEKRTRWFLTKEQADAVRRRFSRE